MLVCRSTVRQEEGETGEGHVSQTVSVHWDLYVSEEGVILMSGAAPSRRQLGEALQDGLLLSAPHHSPEVQHCGQVTPPAEGQRVGEETG